MPKIATYDAPIQTIHPEEKGYAAFETAGRRIGPLYNQAATDIEEAGRLTAQNLEDSGKTAQAIADLLRPPTTSGSGSSGGGARLGRIGSRTGGVGGDVSSFAKSAADLAAATDRATGGKKTTGVEMNNVGSRDEQVKFPLNTDAYFGSASGNVNYGGAAADIGLPILGGDGRILENPQGTRYSDNKTAAQYGEGTYPYNPNYTPSGGLEYLKSLLTSPSVPFVDTGNSYTGE